MIKYIETQLAQRATALGEIKAARAALDDRERVLSVEVALLSQLLAEAGREASAEATPSPEPLTTAADEPRLAPQGAVPETGSKGHTATPGRNLSRRWSVVNAHAVKTHPLPFHFREVPGIQIAAGEEPASIEHCRTQIWAHARAGIYKSLGGGKYVATEKGAAALGLTFGVGHDKPVASPNGSMHSDSAQLFADSAYS